MSIYPNQPSTSALIIKNDQDAINAAYHLADFALEGRNQRDQQGILPIEEVKAFSQKGLGGMRIAQQYGGAFVSHQTIAKVFRIISQADASLAEIAQNQISILNSINSIATTEQKHFLFSEILKGKRITSGGSEDNMKDSSRLKTKLYLQEGEYYLEGEKWNVTGSIFADYFAIDALHPEGYEALIIIDRDATGVEIHHDWQGFGQRTIANGILKLNHVKVNTARILDKRKLNISPKTQDAFSQLLDVAIDVGIANAAFTDTCTAIRQARVLADAKVEYAHLEPFVIQEVGKLTILLDVADLLLHDAAQYLDTLDNVMQISPEQANKALTLVAEAKVYAHDAALLIAEKLFELGGSRSGLAEHHFDQHWRNARVHTLQDPIRWTIHAVGDYYLNHTLPHAYASL